MARDIVAREYLRVSKDRDKQGKSPAQQHEENARAVADQGWELHPEPYQDVDKGASRYSRVTRDGYARLVEDIESGRFGAGILVLWESSRGSRRVGEWATLIDLCDDAGIRIYVTAHDHLYDPSNVRDRRSLQGDAVDSEYETGKSSMRIRRAVNANAREGRPHGKNLYGYQRIYEQGPGGPQLASVVPDPVTGAIVREVANRALSGETYYSIARDLNVRGVPTRRPARHDYNQSRGWTGAMLKQMLSRPAYAGLREHNGEIVGEAVWPAIIPEGEWRRLQVKRADAPPERDVKRLLVGLAECSGCGGRLRSGRQSAGRGKDGQARRYSTYICAGYASPTPGTKHVSIKEEHLDQIVSKAVIARLSRPDFLTAAQSFDGGVDEERARLSEQIKADKEYLDEVRQRAAEAGMFDLVIDQERRVRPRIESNEQRLRALSGHSEDVLALAGEEDVRAAWERLDVNRQRTVIRTLMIPVVKPAQRGQKGIQQDRVEFRWLGGDHQRSQSARAEGSAEGDVPAP